MTNSFQDFLDRQGVVILDGGLATCLEERGHNLNSQLWSAQMLIDSPHEISAIHHLFLGAGADCITTASYQASYEGFSRFGFDEAGTDELLIRSVVLALDSVNDFWSNLPRNSSRIRPLVAASIGPYGAYLADGSEYDGRYGITDQDLIDFHKRRFSLLATSEADLVVCETIPSMDEARVLLGLFDETPNARGWISFSCRDGGHLSENIEGRVGVGVNCTAPRFVNELITRIQSRTERAVIVYPNSGENWDAKNKRWIGADSGEDWVKMAVMWQRTGARGIGGCCRIGPDVIEQVRSQIVPI